jgi:simple sugar transport system permease protein
MSGGTGIWRLEERPERSVRASVLIRIGCVAVVLLGAALLLQLQSRSAIDLLTHAFGETLGTAYGREQAAILATPIILTAVAAAVAMRMRYWNVGAEGQLFIGAWAATGVGLFVEGPGWLVLGLMAIASIIAGAAWIAIPALARAYAGTSEIVTTLLLTPVAILVVNHFSIGPWRDRTVGTLVSSYRVEVELPSLGVAQVHAGALLAVALPFVVWLLFRRSIFGYEVKVAGRNHAAGRFAGIRVQRRTVAILLASGAIAGAAGMVELAGTAHRLSGSLSNGYGYIGLLVAVICSANVIACIPVGFLFAALLNAGTVLQIQGIPYSAVVALNGAILMAVAVSEVAARYTFVRRLAASTEATASEVVSDAE